VGQFGVCVGALYSPFHLNCRQADWRWLNDTISMALDEISRWQWKLL